MYLDGNSNLGPRIVLVYAIHNHHAQLHELTCTCITPSGLYNTVTKVRYTYMYCTCIM